MKRLSPFHPLVLTLALAMPDARLTAGPGQGILAVHPADPAPNLPPAAVVEQVLRTNPGIKAVDSQIPVAKANRSQLEAGDYEWTLLLGGQQRRVSPDIGPSDRFQEWNGDLQRQVRLPGKAELDTQLGDLGVHQAEKRRDDSEHEAQRNLLKCWFTWLKEGAAVNQWEAEVALLKKHAKAVARRHELGDAAQLERVQGDAALARAEAQLAQAQGRRDTAAEDLRRRYPGLPLEEQKTIANPPPLAEDQDEWVRAIVQRSHEVGLAQGDIHESRVKVERARSDRYPDPTFGLHMASERDGEENIIGAYVIVNLPGGGRRAKADAALAEALSANEREAATLQKVTAEAASLYQAARAARISWQSASQAATRLGQAADMTARAYQLGEGNLTDLLTARRGANDAQLSARLSQLEALEYSYRLRLDAHRIWDFDRDHPQPKNHDPIP